MANGNSVVIIASINDKSGLEEERLEISCSTQFVGAAMAIGETALSKVAISIASGAVLLQRKLSGKQA